MTNEREQSEKRAGRSQDAARQARLKQALRDNLKRRKSQARGRDAETAAAKDDGAREKT